MAEQTRNVIVTGAARGMGAAVVRRLAARGVNVVAVDRLADELGELKNELKAAPGEVDPVVADVGSATDVQGFVSRAVERFGGLDGIFNIAAILGEFAPIAESTNDGFDEVMRVNTKSVWLGMKYAIPALIARGGGAIVNTGSYLAWHGCELLGPYNASKHALVGLTKTAALEYGRYNIRVNIHLSGVDEHADEHRHGGRVLSAGSGGRPQGARGAHGDRPRLGARGGGGGRRLPAPRRAHPDDGHADPGRRRLLGAVTNAAR